MRILVTGGSGFIGTNLIEALQQRGHHVLSADPIAPRNPAHTAIWRKMDLCRRDEVLATVADVQPEAIYHLGARTDLHGRTPADYAANTDGVKNLIEAIRSTGTVQRVFFASSRMVCRIGYQPTGDNDYCPSTPYGESKVETERIVRAADLPIQWCLFRPTSIWGPWFGVPYKDFFMAIARGRYVHPRGRRIRKSFGYVGNSVHQLAALLTAPEALFHRKTFYLADAPLDVEQWARLISAELGRPAPRQVPYGVLKAAALAGDFVKRIGFKEPPLTSFRLDNLLTEMVHDTAAIDRIAGAPPNDLASGVRQTVGWLRSMGEIEKVLNR